VAWWHGPAAAALQAHSSDRGKQGTLQLVTSSAPGGRSSLHHSHHCAASCNALQLLYSIVQPGRQPAADLHCQFCMLLTLQCSGIVPPPASKPPVEVHVTHSSMHSSDMGPLIAWLLPCCPAAAPQDSASSADRRTLAMAIYMRLGCLFYEFKAKPAFCAMYTAVKLGQKVAKGVMLGVFYGRCLAVRAARGPRLHLSAQQQ
jgi:hypothetical protein